ncbi:hypothetical protein PE36_17735 [Moritella sp. PE36]|uniref:hypothetical protein n=1 Tax=Moritella sp. PE36 TaxID=58051 RepID=UPI00015682C4|nr:hypothetical protein [Moritella sp. PE36]EDM67830.1 hypothetical protein PE36_17735 [Moritella sp. PE36]
MNEKVQDTRKIQIDELADIQENTDLENQIQKFLFVIMIGLVLLGAFLWAESQLVATYITNGYFKGNSTSDKAKLVNIKIFGGVLLLFSTVIFSYLHMSGFNLKRIRKIKTEELNTPLNSKENKAIVSLLRSINDSLEKGKLESTLSTHERESIVSKISETVESQLNSALLLKIEGKYGSKIYNDKLSMQAEKSLNSTVVRLKKYADTLQAKATINLVYGIAATISAILILIFVLMNATPPQNDSNIETVFYYTSRLFLVLMVQGISIFFLNLYKTTLNNIIYINNEVTNYEAKRDSLMLAFNSGDSTNTSKMLSNLANTERNFVLKKGETSVFDKGGIPVEPAISATMVADLLNKMNSSGKNT